ncbi:LPS export ABC transporter periplasmic protein LptC [Hymenobacter psychrotolerans]|uniref:LPS export ABC transporter protein LptC n=1 Tax=Hymenobacter psychrotolerans DSM 18569 TaxID=1121959 RepID=A0A1M6Q640_9BACT|nr:LPS export ABC transporter periplasmic protein LptC [Hymenobacter psychrotolerans]SHK15682.1 LPS export ABC transporter protein LptC [Hymenobacter psychrotolerans DSM 18569]
MAAFGLILSCRPVLALVLGAGLLASGCQKKDPAASKKPVEYKGPLLETTNVLTLYSDSAKLQIKYTAPLEQQFESGDKLYPKGIDVTFYTNGGKEVLNTLRGNYGRYDKAKNLYFIRGDVRVSNVQKQQSMKTEEMYFDQEKRLIYNDTTQLVRIQTPTEILTGYGLTANQDFSRYTILKPEGVFTIDQADMKSAN